MTNKQIAKILDLHAANYYIEAGHIYCDVPYAHSLMGSCYRPYRL